MITGSEATQVLVDVNKGTYTIKQHATTQREFKPSYTNDMPGFKYDNRLNDKVLTAYVPHAWIND